MQTNTKWVSDPEHSELSFKIKHLMISSVTGKFNQFEVRTETPEIDFKDSQINLTAQVASISTDNKKRDQHLLGSDFLMPHNFLLWNFSLHNWKKRKAFLCIVRYLKDERPFQ